MISDVDSLYGFVEEATVTSGPQDQYNHQAKHYDFELRHSAADPGELLPGSALRQGTALCQQPQRRGRKSDRRLGHQRHHYVPEGVSAGDSASSTTLSSDFNAGTPRPNITAGCALPISGSAKSKLTKWFNTACFTQPGQFLVGNAPRSQSNLRAQEWINWDLSLVKKTKIFEAQNLEFRAEAFNIANHARFMAPNTTLGSPMFGQVTSTANKPRLLQLALRYNF